MATCTLKADEQDIPFFRIENNVLIGMEETHRDCTNLGQLLLDKLKSKPDFVGQVEADSGKESTNAEILERSVKCAIWLRKHGVQPGDKIGIWTHNHLDTCVPVLASVYIAAVICPWEHDVSKNVARYGLSLMQPKIIFVNAESAQNLMDATKEMNLTITIVTIGSLSGFVSLTDILQEQINPKEIKEFRCIQVKNPHDVSMICCSSGTTGIPKATELSYASFYNSITTIEDVNLIDEVSLWTPTIRWHYGLVLSVEAILSDSRKVIISDTEDEVRMCEIIRKYGVTWFGTDACIPIRFIKYNPLQKYPLPSLRKIVITGSPFSKEMQQALAKILPHTQVLQCYGLTDAGGLCAGQTSISKPGSFGFVTKGIRFKIIDQKTGEVLGANKKGELLVKSKFILNCYHNNPQATKEAIDSHGWLHTKDICYYDDDGELFFVNRISDFINYRGINLSPAEIEDVLKLHPSVLEAVVIGVPHETDVEHPMAFIEKVSGKEVTKDELNSLIKNNLAWYCKLLGGIVFMDKLPQTNTGKIARKQLKQLSKNYRN